MEITYLLNSGFLIRHGQTLLVFDDYEDPAHSVDKALAASFDRLYIFVSHAHFDHFGTCIKNHAPQVEKYIFSNDLRRTKRAKLFPADKIVYMRKYSDWHDDEISVRSFDSTDVGTSYLVELEDGTKIFHAGDFNWWHWEDDTPANIAAADKLFFSQLKKLKGLTADVAFFPVDGRLGDSQELGVREFVKVVKVCGIIAMHNVGYPRWRPSRKFLLATPELQTWAPIESGEFCTYTEGRFIEGKEF